MKKRLAAKVLSTVATISLLSGCAADTKNNSENTVSVTEPTIVQEVVPNDYTKPETDSAIKYAGEHYITYYAYYDNDNDYYDDNNFGNTNGWINANVPSIEGYSVYDVNPITGKYGNGSKTIGFSYHLVNNEDVRVTGYYNPLTDDYDYLEPGTPIRIIKTLD